MFKSSDEFYVNGGYLRENPDWHREGSHWKADLIQEFITQSKLETGTIVEVGCGVGEILVELQKKLPANTVLKGYDISPQAIAIAQQKANPQLQFYLEDYSSQDQSPADILLLMDVVEHVDDFYSFIRRLRTKGKQFIFHIPLDMSCRTLLKPHVLLQQRRSVGHIHYFTEETVMWMLQDLGFEVEQIVYTKPDVDVIKPASFKQWVKKQLRKFSYAVNRKLSVKLWGGYSVLVLAKPILKTDE